MVTRSSPWASGPREILKHALELLRKDSDTNRRLALIIADNAVELIVKTFLGLPKRVTGLHLPRAKLQEISESFPKLLDALEEYAGDKLNGLNLGEIEWYHRLRNQLYHDGNGLTVDREKVQVYAELAKLLFQRLFEEELAVDLGPDAAPLGDFLAKWAQFERGLISYSEFVGDTFGRTPNVLAAARLLVDEDKMSTSIFERFRKILDVRNKLVHGEADRQSLLTPEILSEFNALDTWLLKVDKEYREEPMREFERIKQRILYTGIANDLPVELNKLRDFLIGRGLAHRPKIAPFFERWLTHMTVQQGIPALNVFSAGDIEQMKEHLRGLQL
jgi:hypothetical protein